MRSVTHFCLFSVMFKSTTQLAHGLTWSLSFWTDQMRSVCHALLFSVMFKSTTQLVHSKNTLRIFPFIILSCCSGLKKDLDKNVCMYTIRSICFVVRVVLTLHGISLQFISVGGKIQVTLGNVPFRLS